MFLCLGYGLLFYFYPTNNAYLLFPLPTLYCSHLLLQILHAPQCPLIFLKEE